MSEAYIPGPEHKPFYVTDDNFRVWTTDREGHFICASPGYATYRGDLRGVEHFIERMRRELKK